MAELAERKLRRTPLNAVVAVLAVAAVGTAATLWLEPFAGPGLAAVAVFVFPVPVALGLAAGLVSPRRTILWAPVYAAIATSVAVLLLVGVAESARALPTVIRVMLGAAAIVVSGASAVLGERLAERGWYGKAVLAATLGCALLVLVAHLVTAQKDRTYQRLVVPQTLLDVDANYVALGKGFTWWCVRTRSLGCYRIGGVVAGREVVVYGAKDSPSVLGIRYRIGRRGTSVRTSADALAYLRGLGFRDRLLSSLSERKGLRGSWCAGLELTRLTLELDGTVLLEPFPPFAARRSALRSVTGTRRASGA